MWYLLKVDALVAAVVFAPAGLIILALFAWQETKSAARYFANLFAISRPVSRSHSRTGFAAPWFQ